MIQLDYSNERIPFTASQLPWKLKMTKRWHYTLFNKDTLKLLKTQTIPNPMHMFLKLIVDICVAGYFCLFLCFVLEKTSYVDNGSIYSKYKTRLVDCETIKAPGEYALVKNNIIIMVILQDFQN